MTELLNEHESQNQNVRLDAPYPRFVKVKVHSKPHGTKPSARTNPSTPSHGVVMEQPPHILRPQLVPFDELLVAWRPLVLAVPREHALEAHADALDVLHGRPALPIQQVEADEAVGVDVRVDGDGAIGVLDKDDFGGVCRRGS